MRSPRRSLYNPLRQRFKQYLGDRFAFAIEAHRCRSLCANTVQ
ncbi:hypothetical protein [Nostoc edaphicum]|nr:hypothetical protein [Nostoc edaphicum]